MKIKRLVTFCLFTLLLALNINAQKQGNIWYFGDQAGLDFNSGSPVVLTNSAMTTNEGCATISDRNGNLLFYTDGQEVYDANHNQMPNGVGLKGAASSTQSGIIVPMPGSNTRFFIFTVDDLAKADGLQYSEVDLTLNGGMGDVSSKNNPLITPVTEKITSVHHANSLNFWVITHGWNNDEFYAFEVTPTGVNPVPVTSKIGTAHTGLAGNTLGYLKASSDGEKIACAIYDSGVFEVFDFDNATGIVSNKVTLASPDYQTAYGIEFSADVSKLYGTVESSSEIYQWDLLAGGPAAIAASATLIGTSSSNRIGALQIAQNEKIYVSRVAALELAVINDPNQSGLASNFQDNGPGLSGRRARLGLPTFIQSFFNLPSFTQANFCFGDPTIFTLSDSLNIDSVRWNFGDTGSSNENESAFGSPVHIYSDTGNFYIALHIHHDGLTDTLRDTLKIFPIPYVELGGDKNPCEGEVFTLNAGNPYAIITWQNGSNEPSQTIRESGIYFVEVNAVCGVERDTVQFTYHLNPKPFLRSDTSICPGEEVILATDTGFAGYIWSEGAQNKSSIIVDQPGVYGVWVQDQFGCSGRAEMNIFKNPCLSGIFIPTAFTPNGDGMNDIFVVVEKDQTLTELQIFNRWGNMIFMAESAEQGWDGRYDGMECPEGMYTWKLQFLDKEQLTDSKTGGILLLR